MTGPRSRRTLSIDDFFTGTFTTALTPAELLTEIRVPRQVPGSGGSYKKLKRKTGDFATVAVGVQVRLGPRRTLEAVRIGMAAVGPVPLRAKRAEESLQGRPPSADNLALAARLAAEESQPAADLRGSIGYKRAMVEIFARRALEAALERAGR